MAREETRTHTELERDASFIREQLPKLEALDREARAPMQPYINDVRTLLDLVEHLKRDVHELERLSVAEADLCKERHGGLDPHDVILRKHEMEAVKA